MSVMCIIVSKLCFQKDIYSPIDTVMFLSMYCKCNAFHDVFFYLNSFTGVLWAVYVCWLSNVAVIDSAVESTLTKQCDSLTRIININMSDE